MQCTMPKCGATINGMTGLQELQALVRHFAKKHGVRLMIDEAANVRLDIEAGRVPSLLEAMLYSAMPGKKLEKPR